MVNKRRPPADTDQFVEAFLKETERGCVLAGTGWIEAHMLSLIKAVFRVAAQKHQHFDLEKHEDAVRSLIDSTDLQNASKMAETCYALGLFSKKRLSALKQLFKMRNHFAHWAGHCTLSDEHIKPEIANFLQLVVDEKTYLESIDAADLLDKKRATKVRFIHAVLILSMEMTQAETDVLLDGKPRKDKSTRYVGYMPFIPKAGCPSPRNPPTEKQE